MKKTIIILGTIALGLIAITSCNKEREEAKAPAGPIHFGVSTSYENTPETKTAYTGEDPDGNPITSSSSIERIDWVAGDIIRIVSLQATIEGSTDKYADYAITPGTDASTATISPYTGNGLQWGEGSHCFFALYPSPEQNSSATINFVNNSVNTVKIDGNIPSEQTVTLEDHAFKPDMDYAYMYAVTSGVSESENVQLDFQPLVTTLEFTLLASTAGTTEKLTSVKLSTTRGTRLAGDWTAVIDDLYGVFPGFTQGIDEITITLPNGGVRLSETEAYTVTFLTLPLEQTELTLTLNFADGSKKTLALKNNGNWVTIPACKKTYIWNLAVPAPQVVVYPAVGEFTVNAEGKKVGFARANLKYTGKGDGTGSWSIMDNPWDVVETGSVATNYGHSDSSTEVISLFGWGTSGNGDGTRSDPWRTDKDLESYGPNGAYDLTGDNFKYDWAFNTIVNLEGSNWRTPSMDEWDYILKQRGSLVDHPYTRATVEGMQGLVLFPDEFDFNNSPFSFNSSYESASYSIYVITASDWSALEAEGCVFLPAAGYRYGTDVGKVGERSYYWSSTANGTDQAYGIFNLRTDYYDGRSVGFSVRLVRELE